MRDVIVSAEIVCMIFSFIILFGMIFENHTKSQTRSLFIGLTISVIMTLFIDVLSWILDLYPKWYSIGYLINTLDLLMGRVDIVIFSYYVLSHINTLHRTPYTHAHIICGISIFGSIFVIIGTMTGNMFTLHNGEYIYGPLYLFHGIQTTVTLIYVLFVILSKGKLIGLHDTVAYCLYIMVPMIAAIIEITFPKLSFSYIATSLCIGLIFVMIQIREIDNSHKREQRLEKASYIDHLTKLNNRRALDHLIATMDRSINLGVLFCDLNGLKIKNDTYGHAEGDRLILEFVQLARKFFDKEYIYRMSGDEFIFVCMHLDEYAFKHKVNKFKKEITSHKEISAIGSAYGMSAEISELIHKAEKMMYGDKESYYVRTGVERRINEKKVAR